MNFESTVPALLKLEQLRRTADRRRAEARALGDRRQELVEVRRRLQRELTSLPAAKPAKPTPSALDKMRADRAAERAQMTSGNGLPIHELPGASIALQRSTLEVALDLVSQMIEAAEAEAASIDATGAIHQFNSAARYLADQSEVLHQLPREVFDQ